MTLFDAQPEPLISAPKPRAKRDDGWHELFRACEATFYPSGIAKGQRARVANVVDDLHEKGATAAEFARRRVRYTQLYPTTVCTLPAMLNQWDMCGAAPVATVQPNVSIDAEWDAEQGRLGREKAARDAKLAAARVVLDATPDERVADVYAAWCKQEANPRVLRYVKGAHHALCVCWIAERLEGDKP